MSKLTVDLLEHRTNPGKPPVVTKADFVKVWFLINQTGTQASLASFGTSSIVDNAVGATQVNYTTTFSTTSYSVTVAGAVMSTTASRSNDYVTRLVGSGIFRNAENGSFADTVLADGHFTGVLA